MDLWNRRMSGRARGDGDGACELRTINLAKDVNQLKANICKKGDIPPLRPVAIRICDVQQYRAIKDRPVPPAPAPHYKHGKLMFAFKACVLATVTWWTWNEGVWGDQRDAAECAARWREYIEAIHTRRPPAYDRCGRVIRTPKENSFWTAVYQIYKDVVTTIFGNIVGIPRRIKCSYFDWQEAMRKKRKEEALAKK